MNNKFGSMWHRWDFHIHTPYSILNNNYGFNPFELTDKQENEKAFDIYVQTLFTKAIESNIYGIGITDYFMVDGYKRIVNDYLNNPAKMSTLFPDEEIRRKVEEIYVFPNIELRLDTFVGRGANSVNYHVIFSNSVSIQEIEDNFLHQLKFQANVGTQLSLTRPNIETHGKAIKQNNGASGSDLLVGLKNITVSYSDILEVLSKNSAFIGKYIITIPVDEDLSVIQWDGRDYNTRKNLYQQCHCYMTSNEKTIAWALAEGEEEERKNEFGSLKPCIWGSDAHEYERAFAPANDKFCWIKAEPSFEGLLQILYEPKERVAIQKDYPDEKDVHQIIESIKFEDENFQAEPIVFNDYLTCIIGGKSTGKSLLLQQLAKNIDSSYTLMQEQVSVLNRKQFPVKKAIVTWKDGTSDSRKIVYIPQTFLNRTIDNPEKLTAINKIIADVLQQEPEISNAFLELDDTVKRIKKRVQADIADYCEKMGKLQEIEADIKEEGGPEGFAKIIDELENQRTELAGKTNIKQEEIEKYAELEEVIKSLENQRQAFIKELQNLRMLEKPVVVIPKYFFSSDGVDVSHVFQEDFPCTSEQLENAVYYLNSTIQPEWDGICELQVAGMERKLEDIEKQMKDKKTEYEKLKIKVEQNEQLQKLSIRISAERIKLQIANKRVEDKTKLTEKIDDLQKRIVGSQQEFQVAYNKYCDVVIATGTKKILLFHLMRRQFGNKKIS